MKRLRIHIAEENLDENIRFYSAMFQAGPTVRHADYAKWMLEDPKGAGLEVRELSTHRLEQHIHHAAERAEGVLFRNPLFQGPAAEAFGLGEVGAAHGKVTEHLALDSFSIESSDLRCI